MHIIVIFSKIRPFSITVYIIHSIGEISKFLDWPYNSWNSEIKPEILSSSYFVLGDIFLT